MLRILVRGSLLSRSSCGFLRTLAYVSCGLPDLFSDGIGVIADKVVEDDPLNDVDPANGSLLIGGFDPVKGSLEV